jgi:hypothetical protein
MPPASLRAESRRALQLLVGSPTGCTEALMLAHGFSAELLGGLVLDGLATTEAGTLDAGWRMVRVTWMMITEAGQFELREEVIPRSPAAPPQ